jgi:excisionase family DNA binding protein
MSGLLPANYLTVSQAAPQLGMTVKAIYKALEEGRMPGTKLGAQWLIDVNAVVPATIGCPRSPGPRCPCGANTVKRAKLRAYDCCKRAGVMERWR